MDRQTDGWMSRQRQMSESADIVRQGEGGRRQWEDREIKTEIYLLI